MKDVLAYLQTQGRKTSQSQIYKDLKRGYLRRQADGSFRQRDVDMYASTLQAYALPEKEGDAMSELARQDMEERWPRRASSGWPSRLIARSRKASTFCARM